MFRKRIQQAGAMATSQPKIIHAIHDYDLENFLDSIDLLNSIKAKKIKCKFCKNIVTLDSLYSVFPDSGNISLVCNEDECIQKFLAYKGK
jgi:hypothetical protein